MSAADGRIEGMEWGAAISSLDAGGCGDAHFVAPLSDGALVAAIDGLGHGVEAAAAARLATQCLARNAAEPVALLIQRCHEALHGTRGAAMTIASWHFEDSSMNWAGIGNVEAVLLRADREAQPDRESITLRGGVVGYRLPSVRVSSVTLFRGDTLIMATDGIASEFISDVAREASPREVAENVHRDYARGTDDALVLVVRYLGGSS
ncbi:MAG TPA: SpoIIE family protein phosphatase [Gammaproteobacteria bacterium]